MINFWQHPGLILIFFGVLMLLLPKNFKKPVALGCAVFAIIAMATLPKDPSLIYDLTDTIRLELLQLDGLSYLFVWAFLAVCLVGGIYGLKIATKGEVAASLIYGGSSVAVVLAGDWLTLLLFWEIMAVSSTMLIWLRRTRAASKASFRYLMAHFFGGNVLMVGVVMLLVQGAPEIGPLTQADGLVFWLILIGVFVNGAVPPLHFWISDGYPEATLTGAVFMGSFTTKAAVYVMIRVLADAGGLIIWAGIVMALFGALMALMENDIRRLLSYHIVSQLGMMVAAIGLGTNLGIDGAAAHAINNILYKGVLFMGAGALIYMTGQRRISDFAKIPGLWQKSLITSFSMFVASLAIAGLPFLNGFASKGLITEAFHQQHFELEAFLITLAGVGTLLSITLKINYFVFIKNWRTPVGSASGSSASTLGVASASQQSESGSASGQPAFRKVPVSMNIAMLIMTSGCMFVGFCPRILYGLLPFGAVTDGAGTVYNPFTAHHILEYVGIFIGGAVAFILCKKILEPHETITLDVDWIFRKPGMFLLREAAKAITSVFFDTKDFLEYLTGYLKRLLNNPKREINSILRDLFRNRSHVPKFKEDRDAPVGTLIMSSLIVLVLAFLLAYFILGIRLTR